MNHVFIYRSLAILFCALSLGCVPTENPLSDESDSKPDLRLVGTWYSVKIAHTEEEQKPIQVRLHPTKKTLMQYKEFDLEWIDLAVVKLGDATYLSVTDQPVDKAEKAKLDIFILKATLQKNGEWEIFFMDPDLTGKVIKDKKLAGRVEYNSNFLYQSTEASLTATKAELRAYFSDSKNPPLFSNEPALELLKAKPVLKPQPKGWDEFPDDTKAVDPTRNSHLIETLLWLFGR